MNRLLVIGGASFDVLHLEDRTVESVGGAGMYTAMAARRCGALVTMLSPRLEPCPERLQPVAGIWRSGSVRLFLLRKWFSLRFPIGGGKLNILQRRMTLR